MEGMAACRRQSISFQSYPLAGKESRSAVCPLLLDMASTLRCTV